MRRRVEEVKKKKNHDVLISCLSICRGFRRCETVLGEETRRCWGGVAGREL